MHVAATVAATALLCGGALVGGAVGAVLLLAGGVFTATWIREAERHD